MGETVDGAIDPGLPTSTIFMISGTLVKVYEPNMPASRTAQRSNEPDGFRSRMS
jgi:hypothetical protein